MTCAYYLNNYIQLNLNIINVTHWKVIVLMLSNNFNIQNYGNSSIL
jgi:hypothetical protein